MLFIPLISAATQARHEGYFRIEWDLAAERARGIASGVPFILPVVIDDTREPDALVPDRFRMVQWTRLRSGEVPPEVQQRFLKLWSHRTGVLNHEAARAGSAREFPVVVASREAVGKPGRKTYALLAAAVALIVAAVGWWQFRGGPLAGVAEKTSAPTKGLSEAEQLVKQARDLIYDPDSARNEFGLAENLLKRATDLAPTSGEAWGASALLNHYFFSRAYDHDRQRLARSLAEAEKALRLSPHNTDALLALGLHRQTMDENERARDFLEQAHASDPQNYKVILAQSMQIADWVERAHFNRDAAARVSHPAELYYYAANDFNFAGRWDEARKANDRAIAAQPFWRTFVQGAVTEYSATADSTKMDAWLDRVPELKRDEPRVAFMRYLAAQVRRDGAAAVRVLNALAADYLEDNFYTGPKSYLLAHAYELAGQPSLALEQWQLAEHVVREKLAANPNGRFMRPMLAVLLAAQHRTDEAHRTAAACAVDERVKGDWPAREVLAEAHVLLGEPDRAIALLSGEHPSTQEWGYVSAATLAVEPRWDLLRDRPGYAPLLEQLRRAENGGAGNSSSAATKPDEKSVAVLAFENLSDDKANEYFSDGIADELLTTLQKIPGLRVAARTSAFSFKGKHATAQEVGEKLGMAHIVEGTVQKSGNRVKITARLSKTATNEEVWSKSFGPLELTDVFATQSELAQAIVGELRGRLAGEPAAVQADVAAAQRGGTRNAEAHALYLEGRFLTVQYSRDGILQGAARFRRATELDPNFALAWAALAATSTALGNYNYAALDRPVAEAFAEARRAAVKALALEPRLAEGHMALMLTQWYERDWKGARASAQRALELAPSDAGALSCAAEAANLFGDYDRAVELAMRAVALDPISAPVRYSLVSAYWDQGKLPEAEAEIRRLLAINPEAINNSLMLAVLVILQGRPDEAAAMAERETDDVNRNVGLAFARWGQKRIPEADAALKFVIEHGADRVAFQIAEIYGYRRDVEQAYAWLERADRQRDVGLTYTRTDLFLEPLRNDPRWPALLKKVGLSDQQLK